MNRWFITAVLAIAAVALALSLVRARRYEP